MTHESKVWFTLYREAMTELEHAKITGRIGNARSAIIERIEKLEGIPGLHAEERQAIEDALNGLRMLEREETRYQQNEEKRVAEEALQKRKVSTPKPSK